MSSEVYHGPRLVLVSRRKGRELDIRVPSDHPFLAKYIGLLKVLLKLEFLYVETINDEPASESPYVASLGNEIRTVNIG